MNFGIEKGFVDTATDNTACECAGSHGRFRFCKTGFDSSVGCLKSQESRAESREPETQATSIVILALDSGLSALDSSVLGVCRNARDSAKVEDQVRFLARTFLRLEAGGWREEGGKSATSLIDCHSSSLTPQVSHLKSHTSSLTPQA